MSSTNDRLKSLTTDGRTELLFEQVRAVSRWALPPDDVRLVRLPRVYRPAADSMLLAKSVTAAIDRSDTPAEALELCAGTGYVSLLAARMGAIVTAIDVDRRSVATIRLNARLNRLPVTARRADLRTMQTTRRYDLVFANPPYVPTESATRNSDTGLAWNAGPDGRELLDPICHRAHRLVRPGGTLIIVQSDLSKPEITCRQLRADGFAVTIQESIDVPFGPVLSGRLPYLVEAGLIPPGERTERVSAIVATAPAAQDNSGSSDDCPAVQELNT
ncbi:HemK2/MTQ2 family protein methyltransferase [Gordonia sp. CPCC 205333]|uniref:HemK2/MTQ2 family protein methyltransferase n=1 Tax=Gordonia sp. CPCC 205333 TaxID=3140790 RepID=UPI003AF33118